MNTVLYCANANTLSTTEAMKSVSATVLELVPYIDTLFAELLRCQRHCITVQGIDRMIDSFDKSYTAKLADISDEK